MTSRDFAYWLQGFFEVGRPTTMDAAQVDMVKRHLALVFIHEIDPSAGPPAHQAVLNQAHDHGHDSSLQPGQQTGSVEQQPGSQRPPWMGQQTDGPGGVKYRC